MNAALLAVVGLSMIAIGYRFYSKFLAEKIYQLDPDFETPAHAQRDDIDYVPTNRVVLWGHHFTAVAGAAPIIGPGIAVGLIFAAYINGVAVSDPFHLFCGHLHPLNLALGQAAALESLGGVIYEQSPVLSLEHGAPVTLKTADGTIRADRVVMAGNAYMKGLMPQLEGKSMPASTQVVTTEPLDAATAKDILPTDRAVEDCNYLLDYYRLSGDRRLIYGGGVSYGGQDPNSIEGVIRPKLETTFPQLKGVKIDYAWSGTFLLTLNRLPQFGRINANVYYAQGYSGHGVTCSHLAGRLIAEVLDGQSERFDAFAGLPHLPFPGGQQIV